MVRTRLVQLYKDKALSGDSGTETFPLKTNEQVIAYHMAVRAKNGATSNIVDGAAAQTVSEALTKIEIRSGSAIFKSYTGEMCRRLAAYRDGKNPHALLTQAAGGTWAGHADPLLGWNQEEFPINFTTRQDPYGQVTNTIFPAPLYSNLDLVLNYDFTVSATAGFVTGGSNHVLDLWAETLPREDDMTMKNKNVLVETKKADYTSLASGDESFDLTIDSARRLRQVFVHSYEAGIGEGVDITDLTLKVNGEYDWQGKWGLLQKINARDCKLDWNEKIYTYSSGTDDELWTRVPAPEASYTAFETGSEDAYLSNVGDKVTIAGTTATADNGILSIDSKVLPGMVVIDFDKDGYGRNCIDLAGIKDLDLVLTNGGADATVQIIEQHLQKPFGL
jgi:hypothetical protein